MDYRKKLEKERDKISKTIKEMEDNTLFGDTTKHTSEKYSTGELSSYDNHIGDIGTDVYMQDMDNSLIDHQKYVLNGINEALNKVNDGFRRSKKKLGSVMFKLSQKNRTR